MRSRSSHMTRNEDMPRVINTVVTPLERLRKQFFHRAEKRCEGDQAEVPLRGAIRFRNDGAPEVEHGASGLPDAAPHVMEGTYAGAENRPTFPVNCKVR